MSQAKTPYWIILPPAADRQTWQAAIRDQADRSQLKLAQIGQDLTGADLILSDDATLALEAGAKTENIAVLLSQAGPLSENLSDSAPNLDRHSAVTLATELMQRALKVPANRRFVASQLTAAPVRIFPDFDLHVRDALTNHASPRNLALLKAMAIYEQDQVSWSPDILDIYAKEKNRSANSRTFDATGKPRFIAHGPYLNMPEGQWKAVFRLGFSDALTNKSYRIDWGGMTDFCQFEFRPERPGLYEIEMDWTWLQSAPCEMRLLLMEGIFDGELTIYDIEISRIYPD